MPNLFDLTLLPLYRLRGDELPSPPGLLALTPPRRKARSRARDLLVVHLTLGGNAPFSSVSYHQITSRAAEEFYKTPGSVTSALRAAAITLNGDLLERNMASSGQGRYSLATLVLCAFRGEQLYILEAGPAHLYLLSGNRRQDIYEKELAGRGLGLGQGTKFYLSQLTLNAGDRLLISPRLPEGWEKILQRDHRSASLESLRSVLMRQNMEDHNAVLIEAQPGRGEIIIRKPPRAAKPTLASITKKIAAEPKIHSHQPEPLPVTEFLPKEVAGRGESVHNESKPPQERSVFDALPRKESETPAEVPPPPPEPRAEIPPQAEEPNEPASPPVGKVIARQSALTLAKGIHASREGKNRLNDFLRKMAPRLLPASDSETPVTLPNWMMWLIAVIIPLVVVTIASVVYFRFGRDIQYETAIAEVEAARARALSQEDPVAQRVAWEETLLKLDIAENYGKSAAGDALREEAQQHLDGLLSIYRLHYQPAVADLPHGIRIAAMGTTKTELFMLDSVSGEILRASIVRDGYRYDSTFICRGGNYNEYTVGNLIAMEILPNINGMGASVMGMDARGNLLYCAANKTPQAASLQEPPIGFKEITATALDADVLYILDAPSREVWVYDGTASAFLSYPTSFFEQAPNGMEYAIDLSVSGNDLYLLFADGHLASCTYSLLDSVPMRCTNPVKLTDPHPAAGGGDNFRQALFAEMQIAGTPPALLLLAPETQAIFRFAPRSFTLQNQFHPAAGSLRDGEISTFTLGSEQNLFIAQGDQVYRADLH